MLALSKADRLRNRRGPYLALALSIFLFGVCLVKFQQAGMGVALRTVEASPLNYASSNPAGCIGTWDVTPSPNVPYASFLLGVATLSANDIWAVGVNYNTNGYQRTLTEHWNGSQWSVVPSPNADEDNVLNAVAAAGAN